MTTEPDGPVATDFEADLGGRFGGKAMTDYGRWTCIGALLTDLG